MSNNDNVYKIFVNTVLASASLKAYDRFHKKEYLEKALKILDDVCGWIEEEVSDSL